LRGDLSVRSVLYRLAGSFSHSSISLGYSLRALQRRSIVPLANSAATATYAAIIPGLLSSLCRPPSLLLGTIPISAARIAFLPLSPLQPGPNGLVPSYASHLSTAPTNPAVPNRCLIGRECIAVGLRETIVLMLHGG
jgi:hypothetical protein